MGSRYQQMHFCESGHSKKRKKLSPFCPTAELMWFLNCCRFSPQTSWLMAAFRINVMFYFAKWWVAEWTVRRSGYYYLFIHFFFFFGGGCGLWGVKAIKASQPRCLVLKMKFGVSALRLQKQTWPPHLHLNGFHGRRPEGEVEPKMESLPISATRAVTT